MAERMTVRQFLALAPNEQPSVMAAEALWNDIGRLETELAEAKAEAAPLRAALEAMEPLLRSFDNWCRIDHHGICQSHLADKPCSVAAARRAFGAALSSDAGKELLDILERARDAIRDWEKWASGLDTFPPDDLLEWSRRSLEELGALKGVE